jgi:hypothetical protein
MAVVDNLSGGIGSHTVRFVDAEAVLRQAFAKSAVEGFCGVFFAEEILL